MVPDLFELFIRGLRLAGEVDGKPDAIGEAVGAPGDDEAWLRAYFASGEAERGT